MLAPRINKYVNLKPLAVAVISQALRDVKGHNPEKAVDAVLWLQDGDFPVWSELADMPFADAGELLTSGREMKLDNTGRSKRDNGEIAALFCELSPAQRIALKNLIVPVLKLTRDFVIEEIPVEP